VPKIQGFYDKENSEIAKTALEFLNWHFPLSLEAIEEGLRCRPMCRFEEIDGVIFDVAHNPQGLKRLLEAIDEHYPDREVRFVVGMSQDKNTKECLNLLASRAQYVYLTEAKNSRAAKTERLAQELNEIGFSAFSVEKNPLHAVQRAQLEAEQFNALLVICGSFYIMPEAKSALGELVAQD
jgi:dihydrofolate synthase/folylpolyglutamate synthase